MPKVIGIKLNDADYADWSARAQKEGVRLTTWIRAKVVQGTWSDNENSPKVVLKLHDTANKRTSNRKPNGHTLNCKCWTCCPPT